MYAQSDIIFHEPFVLGPPAKRATFKNKTHSSKPSYDTLYMTSFANKCNLMPKIRNCQLLITHKVTKRTLKWGEGTRLLKTM